MAIEGNENWADIFDSTQNPKDDGSWNQNAPDPNGYDNGYDYDARGWEDAAPEPETAPEPAPEEIEPNEPEERIRTDLPQAQPEFIHEQLDMYNKAQADGEVYEDPYGIGQTALENTWKYMEKTQDKDWSGQWYDMKPPYEDDGIMNVISGWNYPNEAPASPVTEPPKDETKEIDLTAAAERINGKKQSDTEQTGQQGEAFKEEQPVTTQTQTENKPVEENSAYEILLNKYIEEGYTMDAAERMAMNALGTDMADLTPEDLRESMKNRGQYLWEQMKTLATDLYNNVEDLVQMAAGRDPDTGENVRAEYINYFREGMEKAPADIDRKSAEFNRWANRYAEGQWRLAHNGKVYNSRIDDPIYPDGTPMETGEQASNPINEGKGEFTVPEQKEIDEWWGKLGQAERDQVIEQYLKDTAVGKYKDMLNVNTEGNTDNMTWFEQALLYGFPGSQTSNISNFNESAAKLTQPALISFLSSSLAGGAGELIGTGIGAIAGGSGGAMAGGKAGKWVGRVLGFGAGMFENITGKEIPGYHQLGEAADYLADKAEGEIGKFMLSYQKATGAGFGEDSRHYARDIVNAVQNLDKILEVRKDISDEHDSRTMDILMPMAADLGLTFDRGRFAGELINAARTLGSGKEYERLGENETYRYNLGQNEKVDLGMDAEERFNKLADILDAAFAMGMSPEYAAQFANNVKDEFMGSKGMVQELIYNEAFDPWNSAEVVTPRVTGLVGKVTGDQNLVNASAANTGSVFLDMMNVPGADKVITQVGKLFGKEWQKSGGLHEIMEAYVNENRFGNLENTTKFGRSASGIDEKGKLIGYGPTQNTEGLTGWDKIKAKVENFFSFTNESRILYLTNISGSFINNALAEAGGDPVKITAFLDSISNPDLIQPDNPYYDFSKSAAFNTFREDMADAVKMNRPVIDAIIANYSKYEDNRTVLLRLSEALKMKPGDLLNRLEKDPVHFVQMVDNIASKTDGRLPGIDIPIDTKQFGDEIIKRIKPFTGENAVPWSPNELGYAISNKIGDSWQQIELNKYNIKPSPWTYRLADAIKASQNNVFLGVSSTYLMNNIMNNVATRFAVNIGGFASGGKIDKFFSRMGARSERFGDSLASEIGQKSHGEKTQYTRMQEAIADRKKVKGTIGKTKISSDPLTAWKDGANWINRRIGVFGNLSSRVEELESKQAIYAGTKQYMDRTWKAGVNLSRMPADLEAAINAQAPGMSRAIYAAIQSGINTEEINKKVLGDYVQPSIKQSFLDIAAERFGADSENVIGQMFDKTGLLDELEDALEGKDKAGREQVFKEFAQQLELKTAADVADHLVDKADEIKDQVTKAGFKGAIDAASEMINIDLQTQLGSMNQWSKQFSQRLREPMTVSQWRAEVAELQQKINTNYAQLRAEKVQVFDGVLAGLGMEDKYKNQYIKAMSANLNAWDVFYNGKTGKDGDITVKGQKQYFEEYRAKAAFQEGETKESWDVRKKTAWAEYQDNMEKLYDTMSEKEMKFMDNMDKAFSEGMKKATGLKNGELNFIDEKLAHIREVRQQEIALNKSMREQERTLDKFSERDVLWKKNEAQIAEYKKDIARTQQELYSQLRTIEPFIKDIAPDPMEKVDYDAIVQAQINHEEAATMRKAADKYADRAWEKLNGEKNIPPEFLDISNMPTINEAEDIIADLKSKLPQVETKEQVQTTTEKTISTAETNYQTSTLEELNKIYDKWAEADKAEIEAWRKENPKYKRSAKETIPSREDFTNAVLKRIGFENETMSLQKANSVIAKTGRLMPYDIRFGDYENFIVNHRAELNKIREENAPKSSNVTTTTSNTVSVEMLKDFVYHCAGLSGTENPDAYQKLKDALSAEDFQRIKDLTERYNKSSSAFYALNEDAKNIAKDLAKKAYPQIEIVNREDPKEWKFKKSQDKKRKALAADIQKLTVDIARNGQATDPEMLTRVGTQAGPQALQTIANVTQKYNEKLYNLNNPAPVDSKYHTVQATKPYIHGTYRIIAEVHDTDGNVVALVPDNMPIKEVHYDEDISFPVLGVDPKDPEGIVWMAGDDPKTASPTTFQPEKNDMDSTAYKPAMEPKDSPALDPVAMAQQEIAYKDMLPLLKQVSEQYEKDMVNAQMHKYSKLDDDTKTRLKNYLDVTVARDLSNTKYKAMRFGETLRDAALLNYSERYGFDNFLTMIVPYQFWMTRSFDKWMSRIVDHPRLYSHYYRLKKAAEKNEKEYFPARFENKWGIPVLGWPEWRGSRTYVSLGQLDPMSNFLDPINKYDDDKHIAERTAETKLLDKLNENEIDYKQYEEAMRHEGTIWEDAYAVACAEKNVDPSSTSLLKNYVGLNMPLSWTVAKLKDNPSSIGQFPSTRVGNAIGTVTSGTKLETVGKGVKEALTAPERIMRKLFGFEYNEFGDYADFLINRNLRDMIGDDTHTAEEVQRALMEKDGNPVYEEAVERQRQLNAMKVPTMAEIMAIRNLVENDEAPDREKIANIILNMALSTVGQTPYPEGEEAARRLNKEKDEVAKAYENGDKSAWSNWYKENPVKDFEKVIYSTTDPEQQIRNMMYREISRDYYAMSEAEQNDVQNYLGSKFMNSVINKETRAIETMPFEQLAGYYQAFKGVLPGIPESMLKREEVPQYTLPETPDSLVKDWDDYKKWENENFPGIKTTKNIYYSLQSKEEKDKFLEAVPELKQYWKANDEYLEEHKEVAAMVRRNSDYNKDQSSEKVWDILDKTVQKDILDAVINGKDLPDYVEIFVQRAFEEAMADDKYINDNGYKKNIENLKRFVTSLFIEDYQ